MVKVFLGTVAGFASRGRKCMIRLKFLDVFAAITGPIGTKLTWWGVSDGCLRIL